MARFGAELGKICGGRSAESDKLGKVLEFLGFDVAASKYAPAKSSISFSPRARRATPNSFPRRPQAFELRPIKPKIPKIMLERTCAAVKVGLFWLLLALSGCSSDQRLVQYNVRSSGPLERRVGVLQYLDENGKTVVKTQLLPYVVEVKARRNQPIMVLVEGMFPQNKYEVEVLVGKTISDLESVCRVQATGNKEIAVCKGNLGEITRFTRQD